MRYKYLSFTWLIVCVTAIAVLAGCKKINKAPSCSLITPIQQVEMLKEDSVKVLVSATDPDGHIQDVKFYIDNKLVYTDYSEPYEFWLKDLLFGNRELRVIAFDNEDAASSPTTLYIRVIPNNKVSVSLTSMPSTEYLLVGDTVMFTVNAVSSEGTIINSQLYIDDTVILESSTLPYSYIWKYIPEGDHKVYATAIDDKKHEGQAQPVNYYVSQNRAPTITISLEYITTPYMPGDYIGINCDAHDPDNRMVKVEYYFNNVLVQTVTGSDYFDWGTNSVPGGTYQIFAKAYDAQGATAVSNTLTVVVSPGIFCNAVITDMTYSEDDHVVFAADKTKDRLLLIDPVNHIISDSIGLPYASPIAITYSMQDKLLYIVYEFSGVVSVFNKQTNQLSEMTYSTVQKGRDVAIDPIHRRLYILTQAKKLVILNPDNGTVIQPALDIDYADGIALDAQNRYLYSGGDYNARIYKYLVTNDALQEIQFVTAGATAHRININPAGTTVVLPCGGGNGNDGYKLYAYDAADLENVKGQWDIGIYPSFAVFSQDNQRLFGLNGSGDEVYIESTSSYSTISHLRFPNANDRNSIITPNYSGTVLSCFSYDSYYNQRYVIYFIPVQ
jgi:hypothetical protein